MKLKHVKKFKELPPVVGVTYDTKFSDGCKFTVTEVVWKKNTKQTEVADVHQVKGLYSNRMEFEGKPFICPLHIERLILHKSEVGVEDHFECPKCSTRIEP